MIRIVVLTQHENKEPPVVSHNVDGHVYDGPWGEVAPSDDSGSKLAPRGLVGSVRGTPRIPTHPALAIVFIVLNLQRGQ